MKIERGLVETRFGYIHYRKCGQGEPIFLCHINQQSSALYLELMGALSAGLMPIAIDYPSHGMSDHIEEQPTIADYASCIVEVMRGLALSRAHILGEATGAAVAIETAASYPDQIISVVLVNSPFYDAERRIVEERHSPLKDGLRPGDSSGFPLTRTIEFMLEKDPDHSPLHPTQSWMDRINVAHIEAGRDRWQALNALSRYNFADRMEAVACSVLLIMGERFHYVRDLENFRSHLKDVRIHVLSGGRFCMGWERAGDIGPMVLDFTGARSASNSDDE